MQDAGRPFHEQDTSEDPQLSARLTMVRLRTSPERGWSQSELARRVGTTPTQVRKLENGDLNISLEWMQRLAEAFDVKMSAFLPPRQVELYVDAYTAAILELVADLAPEDRPLLAQAARELVAVARRLNASEKGPGLHGDRQLAEQVADRWNRWTESQRRRAADLLQVAEGMAAT